MTARPRLILHIGTHKTATSTLQALMAAERRNLREAGVCYPRTDHPDFIDQNKHIALAEALIHDAAAFDLEWARVRDEFDASGAHTLVLSAEGLSGPAKSLDSSLGPSHTSADEETNFRAAQNTDAAVATAWSARSIQAQKAAAFICVKHHPRIGAAHLAGRLSRKAAIPCSASGPSQASARRRIVSSMTSASMRGPRSRASFLAAATAPGAT